MFEMACYHDSTSSDLPGRSFGQGLGDGHQVVCDVLPVTGKGEGNIPVDLEVHHHLRTHTATAWYQRPASQAGIR